MYKRSLHWFALCTALSTLALIVVGGLVTSHGVGMAVPDWPTSYGYNMFALPLSTWLTGGVFHEHTHRLWASFVGVLVVALTRWAGGRAARRPLAIVGAIEFIGGRALLLLGEEWKGAGHFLSGIGGVVLLAALVWVKNAPSTATVQRWSWVAFWLVQIQGLLGGLRVVLDAHVFAGTTLGTWFGIFHGCLGQGFLVVTALIALFTSRVWLADERWTPAGTVDRGVHRLLVLTTVLIAVQLVIGATMRHQHAGLAIPDFPLAYGQIWPDISVDAVARYNQQRVETVVLNPITATQIVLQMGHRLVALLIVGHVAWVVIRLRRSFGPRQLMRRAGSIWGLLIGCQFALGAWTIWSDKAADVASLHVVFGALSLVTGVILCISSARLRSGPCQVGGVVRGEPGPSEPQPGVDPVAVS